MYAPPWFLFNNHLETIYPSLFRKIPLQAPNRERITTPDADFLDLDWQTQGSSRLLIISHGLEGNSSRAYVQGMARAFYKEGLDILAWNYRGCSGEMNKSLRFYHSGATDDLDVVVRHAISKGYQEIFLLGFSLGGNITLKYLGERQMSNLIKGAVAFSVPLDLHASSIQLSKPSNWIYSRRFLRSLKKKIKKKAALMPELSADGLDKISSLMEFDNRFTGPLHGFKDAITYYRQCGAIKFLEGIAVPTLIVNAQNDPFLSGECFPSAINNLFIRFETPSKGGHVGFSQFNRNGLYWSEERALEFVRTLK